MSTLLVCPYCEFEQDYSIESDSVIDRINHHECDECGKNFTFTAEASVEYYSTKADCLNDGEHTWKFENVYVPRRWARMKCKTCSSTRKLTEKEISEYDSITLSRSVDN